MKILIKIIEMFIILLLFVLIFVNFKYKKELDLKRLGKPSIKREVKKTKSTIKDYQNDFDSRKCV